MLLSGEVCFRDNTAAVGMHRTRWDLALKELRSSFSPETLKIFIHGHPSDFAHS